MNSYVFLVKGYFWSAGDKFGWNKNDPGVGIKYKKIREAQDGRIYVKSRYDYMSIAGRLALEEVAKYHSTMMIGNTEVAVLPKSRFTKEKITKASAKRSLLEEQGQLSLL